MQMEMEIKTNKTISNRNHKRNHNRNHKTIYNRMHNNRRAAKNKSKFLWKLMT